MTNPSSDSRSSSSVATVPCGRALQWRRPLESARACLPTLRLCEEGKDSGLSSHLLLGRKCPWSSQTLRPGLSAFCRRVASNIHPSHFYCVNFHVPCTVWGHRQGASPAELRDGDSESGTRLGRQPVWRARLVCVGPSGAPGPDSGRAGKA